MISIAIGPISVTLDISNKLLAKLAAKRYKGYAGKPKRCDIAVSCTFTRVKQSSLQRVHLAAGDSGDWHAVRYDFSCRWNGRRGTAVLWASLYSLDAMLRVILATSLLSRNAMLIHASSVFSSGSAVLFAGPSGAGKTTAARLCAKCRIVNDEITALYVSKTGDVRISGTPFWGEMGSGPFYARSFGLRSVLFLHKGSQTRRQPVAAARAVGALLRCVCLFGTSDREISGALATCGRIVQAVDCADFYFEKKTLAWGTLLAKPQTAGQHGIHS